MLCMKGIIEEYYSILYMFVDYSIVHILVRRHTELNQNLLIYIADCLHDVLRDVPKHHEREAEKETQSATKLSNEGEERIVVNLLHHCLHVGREGNTEYHFSWVFLVTVEYRRFLKYKIHSKVVIIKYWSDLGFFVFHERARHTTASVTTVR